MSQLAQATDVELPEEDVAIDPLATLVGRLSRYMALLVAWVATAGSLFFSWGLGWLPCDLCWYQRILMYPLAFLLPVAILRRDRRVHLYALPFTLIGACVSTYHYLLIKTNLFPPPPCTSGVPCTVDYIDIFGVINIPFLALTAFIIISAMLLISMPAREFVAPMEGSEPAPAATWLAVFGIILAVVVSFVTLAAVI
ncbi:MAG: disulfide bond formation protein B [Roseiflexaceae bacterium]